MSSPSLTLLENISHIALERFDTLRAQGRLFYEPSEGEIVEDAGFKFEFRIIRVILNKPVLSRDAHGRRGGGPFINPDPDFVISAVGADHLLDLNLYCVYRPAYVLHTRLFASQNDDLDITDIAAAHAVMANLGRTTPQMMIYNCGVDAGSSQGHKHMQLFPLSDSFPLFPETANSEKEVASSIPGVPYQHFVLRLPQNTEPAHILSAYQRLLSLTREALARHGEGSRDYNVAMTDTWICLIPRRHGRRGTTGANAATMLGLVWARDEAERASWDELGLSRHLEYLGIPVDPSKL